MDKFWFTPSFQEVSIAKDFQTHLVEYLYESGFSETLELREANVVFQMVNDQTRPFRRQHYAVYVIGVTFVSALDRHNDLLKQFYSTHIRSLSNILIVVAGSVTDPQFVITTLERGAVLISAEDDSIENRYHQLVERIAPLMRSHLIIRNRFNPNLPSNLWNGTSNTQSLSRAGQILESWDLLPAPFPMEDYLSPEDMAHVRRLFGIGGLSYGNLSVRHDATSFWMSASGVDKSRLHDIGRDILLVTDFDAEEESMNLSVPTTIAPRRVSVDAIEHWKIYRQYPDVGAIIHIHAWMPEIVATEFNYPCGSKELADEVSKQLSLTEDPAHAVIGLKNHGLTITGESPEEILARIYDRVVRQVPMQ
ncbi:class II aldolase/adducin family protein [Sulfobacillus thermosulfidooxidans]|uniref:class II aldolase/adducin family protein n=1 Tax=Sulfobacillus thermosulfidooxidans TaxID=28034 RepID=UPI00096B6B1F|nr:class II aldolase/adducin family protein [Sulfobacillus thermosulfidooxidans]OLZ10345.1 ribulose phosphate epimerase [Sulfobacillus thermosulfidooxidans]OLZ17398.1 ribulose phosphate epimerase [Sulfobacillus thermosulfidooxidans]OLZ21092.1 ribulose phosphate epimerase [Sulfobacillus thermosulfidooxidans]